MLVEYWIQPTFLRFTVHPAKHGKQSIASFRPRTDEIPISADKPESFDIKIDPNDPKKLILEYAGVPRRCYHRFSTPNPAQKTQAALIGKRILSTEAIEIFCNIFGVDSGFTLNAPELLLAVPWMNGGRLGETQRVLHLRAAELSDRMHQDIHYSVNRQNELEFEIPIKKEDYSLYWLSLRADNEPNSGIQIGYDDNHKLTRVFLKRDSATGQVSLWREYAYDADLKQYWIGNLGKGPNNFARPTNVSTRLIGEDWGSTSKSNVVALEFRAFGLSTGFNLKAPKLLDRPKWLLS